MGCFQPGLITKISAVGAGHRVSWWRPQPSLLGAHEEGMCVRAVFIDSANTFQRGCPDVSSHGVHEDRWLFLQPHSVAWGRGWARALAYGNTPPPAPQSPGAASSNSASSTGLKAKSLQLFPWHFPRLPHTNTPNWVISVARQGSWHDLIQAVWPTPAPSLPTLSRASGWTLPRLSFYICSMGMKDRLCANGMC